MPVASILAGIAGIAGCLPNDDETYIIWLATKKVYHFNIINKKARIKRAFIYRVRLIYRSGISCALTSITVKPFSLPFSSV
jgi:hypothetical protein